jgi:hypothetical protein
VVLAEPDIILIKYCIWRFALIVDLITAN